MEENENTIVNDENTSDNETLESYRLTTADNDKDPFTEFTQWWINDTIYLRYNTCGKIAREYSMLLKEKGLQESELTEQEERVLTNEAINNVIKYDFMNIYRRVKPGEVLSLREAGNS